MASRLRTAAVVLLIAVGHAGVSEAQEPPPLPSPSVGFDFMRPPGTPPFPADGSANGGRTRANGPEGESLQLIWRCEGLDTMRVSTSVPQRVETNDPVTVYWEAPGDTTANREPGRLYPTPYGATYFEGTSAHALTRFALEHPVVVLWFSREGHVLKHGPYPFGVRGLRDILDGMPCATRFRMR